MAITREPLRGRPIVVQVADLSADANAVRCAGPAVGV